jgi:hypothetical protein
MRREVSQCYIVTPSQTDEKRRNSSEREREDVKREMERRKRGAKQKRPRISISDEKHGKISQLHGLREQGILLRQETLFAATTIDHEDDDRNNEYLDVRDSGSHSHV